ncbi:MAG: NADH-quinone oxidoreductase subunit N [Coriobacteriia bacterium]|nr:NADH-quinone oxidoreductase subunit N [Coriobacteriia bacterium]
MGSFALIAPEVVLLAGAIAVLFVDALYRGRERAGAWIGVAAALAAAGIALAAGRGSIDLFAGQLVVDGPAQVAKVATALLAAVFLLWLAGAGLNRGSIKEFTALVLFATLGAMLMASARDWVVLLLALETATMPAYVLMGFDRTDDRSLEGAMKYFLLSMVSSLLFLYGVSFVVGMSGTTLLTGARLMPGGVGLVAAVFIFAGLLAKLSAAPFQWWSPDAYAGAPAASVAFVSSVPKIGGLIAFAQVVRYLAPQEPRLLYVLVAGAVLSMLIGNLAAYPQQDLRRLMAYSGIAHAGYLLVGLAAAASELSASAGSATGLVSGPGLTAAVFYSIAYAVPSMAVMLVVAREGDRLDDLKGLASRRPAAAWTMVLLLVSLVGVPPLAGFAGKLYLFGSAMSAGLTWLALFAVVMSVVSAGYYFRIVRAMFFAAPVRASAVTRLSRPVAVALFLLAAATVVLGIAGSPLLSALGFTLP